MKTRESTLPWNHNSVDSVPDVKLCEIEHFFVCPRNRPVYSAFVNQLYLYILHACL